jgi:hypothetical protein
MKMPSGKIVPVPDSIAFSEMPGDRFTTFFDQSMEIICRDVLKGYNRDDLIREVESRG